MEGRARSGDGKAGSWVVKQDSSRAEADLFPMDTDLQVKMCCWYEVDGHFNGSWDFYLKMLHADSKTGEWTKVDPGSSCMKEMLEENKYVPSFLKMTSQGDCRSCLKELKLHWGEKLEPTGN